MLFSGWKPDTGTSRLGDAVEGAFPGTSGHTAPERGRAEPSDDTEVSCPRLDAAAEAWIVVSS